MTPAEIEQMSSEMMEHLALRWGGMPTDVVRPAFGLLANGRPVPVSLLASQIGLDEDKVRAVLDKAPVELDNQSRMINIFGFKLAPTRHRLEFDGIALFSCCALWAHFLPRLVGRSARVESIDPVSSRVIRLTISPEGLAEVDPPDAAATLVRTNMEELQSNVGGNFCCHINHFASVATAEEFACENPRRYVVDIATMNSLATQLIERVWFPDSIRGSLSQ